MNLRNYFFIFSIFLVFFFGIESAFASNLDDVGLEEDGLFLTLISSAVDSDGFVYVVDNDNHNVQKFDSNGKFILKWTSKNPGNTMFEHPFGIAIDSQDNVFVVDQNPGKIKKLSDSGYISSSFGSFGFNEDNFGNPTSIAIDSEDNLYIVDYGFEKVKKFSNDGEFLDSWGSEGSGTGQFSRPLGIAIDSANNVYVLDEGNIKDENGKQYSRVQKFSPDGDFLLTWGSYGTNDGEFLSPSSIAIDSSDLIYITDFEREFLQKFSSKGEFIEKMVISKDVTKNYSGVSSVSIDKITGNFFITNNIDKQILKFSPDGLLLSQWGGEASWDHIASVSDDDAKKQKSPEDSDGLYNKQGFPVTLIEKNQETTVTFYLDSAKYSKNYITAVTKYQFSSFDNEKVSLKSEESKPIMLNSKDSTIEMSFPFSWHDNGFYHLRQFVEYTDNLGNTNIPYGNTEPIFVVEKTGKAINNEGSCKRSDFVPFISNNFLKVACVSYDTSLALYHRDW